jgi:dephospho-CoA kinase
MCMFCAIACRKRSERYLPILNQLKGDLCKGELLTRQNLIDVGNDLRQRYGTGILAQLVCSSATQELSVRYRPRTLVIIDAIRNLGEVEEFRKEWGQRFKLIAIEASDESRFSRMLSRKREGEGTAISQNTQQADRDIGIDLCIQMADWHISNNGSLEELEERVCDFANQWIVSYAKAKVP